MVTKEHKVAYYWAIYWNGVKQGSHPIKGYDEQQVCAFYATQILHKPFHGRLEEELEAFKIIKVNEEHSSYPSAVNIFEKMNYYSFDLRTDENGFVVIPVINSKAEIHHTETEKPKEPDQIEIGFGDYEFKASKTQFQEDWD